jgi:hypothetical protein
VEPLWQTALVPHLCSNTSAIPATLNHGRCNLSLTVDRTGHLNREIARSSGHRELDKDDRAGATAATVPASMPQVKLDLTVPIRTSLQ